MTVERIKLAKVVDVKGGKRLPAGASFSSEPTAHPYIRGQDIRGGRIRAGEQLYIAEEVFEKIRRYTVKEGDVCVTIVGNIGDVGVTPPELDGANLTENAVKLIPTTSKLDTRFLAYALLSPEAQQQMKLSAAGAAQPKLGIYKVNDIEIPFPGVDRQRRIASILAGYDDLIENNTRRIAILEEMAWRIYEEWFVRFRFPGHEDVRMVESQLGLVPEGWNRVPLGLLVRHHIGGGWGQEAATEEFSVPAYVIRGTDIPDVRLSSLGRSPLRFHTPSNFRSRQLQARDIVFEVSGGSKDQPVGRAVMVGEALLSRADAPVICASFCRLVRADQNQILPELLRFHFDHIYATREIMQYQTQSTGITNFKFTVFLEKEMVLKPPVDVQAQFAEVARPMLQLAESLGIKNSVLRVTRDLLLPKLISGELDVSAVPEPEALAA